MGKKKNTEKKETVTERDEAQELSFARVYEGKLELPQALHQKIKEVSCLSDREEQQVYLLEEESGRRSILKIARGDKGVFLETEAENLRKIYFSFIPQVYACFQENGRTFLWKEYIAGDTLYEKVEQGGPLSEDEAGEIMVRLCRMLEQLHKCTPPLIHRDLKPQNIVVTPERNLFFIDMETIREYRETAEYDTVFMGTRKTAAPEQYGFRQTDCRTDVYSLGIVCLYLLTGSMDVQKDTIMEMLSPPFRQIIKTCTKLDPRERYQNCGELQAALQVAKTGAVPGQPKKIRKKNWIAAVAVADAAALALCFFVGRALWTSYQWENGEYHFASEFIEQAVRAQLGKERGPVTGAELELVNSLRICGDQILSQEAHHSSYMGYHSVDDMGVEGYGNIRSLEDCAHMKNLQTLVLDRQRITDLSPLEGLPLTFVSLCDNEISDVTPLAGCEYLRELYLDQTELEDLSQLTGFPQLNVLDISETRVTDLKPLEGLPLEMLIAQQIEVKNAEALVKLPLKTLHLIDGEQVEEAVGKIDTLQILTLPGYHSSTLEPLLGLKNITDLNLSYGKLGSIEGIEAFPGLRWLALEKTEVEDLSPLETCTGLESLSVINSDVMEFDVLNQLINLRNLDCDQVQEPLVYKAVPNPWFQISVYERNEES